MRSSSGRRGRRSFSFSVRMTSSAPSEPTQPSKLPPFGTVSRWEPNQRVGRSSRSPARRARRKNPEPGGPPARQPPEAGKIIERVPEPFGVDELRGAADGRLARFGQARLLGEQGRAGHPRPGPPPPPPA